jgi:hypothetical protein
MRLGSFMFSIFMFCLLTWRWGYQYGTNDQVELLPYTLFLSDSSFYLHDFFIQSLNANTPNERTVMATLLLPFIRHMEVWNIVFHILFSLVLFIGLDKLGKMLLTNEWLSRLALAISFMLFYDYGPGGNEIWVAGFQASSIACAFVPWAIILFLNARYNWSALLFGLLSLIQSLDGLNVWIAFSGVLFILCLAKRVEWGHFFSWCAIYMVVAAPLLLGIFFAKSGVQSSLTDAEVFNIMFRFRHPHHFIFSTFSKAHMVVFFVLSFCTLLYFASSSTKLFLFVAVSLFAMVCYAIAVDLLHFIPIANFQVYKMGQWVKLLGVFAMIGLAKDHLPLDWIPRNNRYVLTGLGIASAILVLSITTSSGLKNPNADYQFPGNDDDAIAICKEIERITPKNAVFIQPFAFTAVKWHARRSSYVEFKANVRNKAFVGQWYKRVQQLYGVDYTRNEMGFDMEKKADEYFNHLSKEELQTLKGSGVTYVLTFSDALPAGYAAIIQNNSYAVFKL